MDELVNIECATATDAETLREALRKISGLNVEDELFAKAGEFDVRKLVSFTASTVAVTAAIVIILSTLSSLGYNDIKINGKVVALSSISLEGAIEAKKNNSSNH